MSLGNMSGRFSGGKYAIVDADMLNISNGTDLNNMRREGKKGSNYPSDGIEYEDITKVISQDEIWLDDFGSLKEEGNEKIELFGEQEVYCCGEIDYGQASEWGSQIRDVRESKNGKGVAVRYEHKQAGVLRGRQAEKQGASLGVPEEYDRSGELRRLSVVVSMLEEVEEPEVEEFGHVLEYPTMRRPISYR